MTAREYITELCPPSIERVQELEQFADSALYLAFGDEWRNMERGRSVVIQDFLNANISSAEYAELIYPGNLQSYADTLLVKR